MGYEFSFNIFDEASVSEWRGRDLKLVNQIPNIDLLVIAVKKVQLSVGLQGIVEQLTLLNDLSRGFFFPLKIAK